MTNKEEIQDLKKKRNNLVIEWWITIIFTIITYSLCIYVAFFVSKIIAAITVIAILVFTKSPYKTIKEIQNIDKELSKISKRKPKPFWKLE